MSKYELNSAEERYQPDSGDTVLANKLGIIDEYEMEALESGLLLMLYEQLFIEGPPPTTLAFNSIREWHRQWLGNVYQVHHKLPLDDSGNNNFDNLVLISTRPEHAAFTTTQKHITKNLTPTGTNIVLWPKPQGIIYP
ncbi:HNH endonuclease signature motif containing protein [Yersinia pseudotuberculosis]|uniref:HNH endonuclease signature motif containing protein n=1 Tax=Yersinia pseudotuberculosis TaxID=633 RepID=UPI003D7E2FE0